MIRRPPRSPLFPSPTLFRSPWLAPSHVLFAGRTFALGAEPLVVGRAPGAGQALTLAEGLAGVSRRHRSEEHTSELQSPCKLVCRLLLEKKKKVRQPRASF